MPFIRYDTATGQILQFMRDGIDQAYLYQSSTTSTLEVDDILCIIDKLYVDNGTIAFKPNQPDSAHVWDWSMKAWVFSQDAFARIKDDAKGAINCKAGDIIISRLPLWKQSNLTARAVELQSMRPVWSSDDQVEWDALQAEWDWVKLIRAQSNAAINAIDASDLIDEIKAIVNGFYPV